MCPCCPRRLHTRGKRWLAWGAQQQPDDAPDPHAARAAYDGAGAAPRPHQPALASSCLDRAVADMLVSSGICQWPCAERGRATDASGPLLASGAADAPPLSDGSPGGGGGAAASTATAERPLKPRPASASAPGTPGSPDAAGAGEGGGAAAAAEPGGLGRVSSSCAPHNIQGLPASLNGRMRPPLQVRRAARLQPLGLAGPGARPRKRPVQQCRGPFGAVPRQKFSAAPLSGPNLVRCMGEAAAARARSGRADAGGRRAAAARSTELLRLGLVMALAMTLHNLPEGFAVGGLVMLRLGFMTGSTVSR